MPLSTIAADAFGAVVISLVILLAILGGLCIYQVSAFQIQVRRRGHLQLSYFNGPWIIRVALILVSILWGFGEVARLSFIKGRIFSSITWQKNICKAYLLSNLGFVEPCIFLMLVFLLRASLQNRESDALSQRWNRRSIGQILLFCFPVLLLQTFLVLGGSKFINPKNYGRGNMAKYWARSNFLIEGHCVCFYPLSSTILLGLVYVLLVLYVLYIGVYMIALVINRRLRRRLYWIIYSVMVFLPMRALLLGFSVLPQPGSITYEIMIFLAFLVIFLCIMIEIVMLVYHPVADSISMAEWELEPREMVEMPFDDYYYSGDVSLITNQSRHETGRSSDVSTKRGSISFCTLIRVDNSGSDAFESNSHSALRISSPSESYQMTPARNVA